MYPFHSLPCLETNQSEIGKHLVHCLESLYLVVLEHPWAMNFLLLLVVTTT
jgi:hypothetical protein